MNKHKPDTNQYDAATRDDELLVVVAPPGCGKTELLAMRCRYLIDQGYVRRGHRVLAVTFSNKARDNLAERLRDFLGRSDFLRYVTVQNFHGLAARILLAHYNNVGFVDQPTLPNKAWLKRHIASASPYYEEKRAAEDAIAEAKRDNLSDDDVRMHIADSGIAAAEQLETKRIEEGRVDYSDLLRYARALLQEETVGHLYRCHFDAVLVDEFQDLSLHQYAICNMLTNSRQTFVGDPAQGIFTWAGAAPDAVLDSLQSRTEEVIPLRTSYRSSRKVLEVVNSIGVQLGAAELTSGIEDRWSDAGFSAAVVFDDEFEEARSLVQLARAKILQNSSLSFAIIVRSGFRRKALDRAADAIEDIPVYRWDLAVDDPSIVKRLSETARSVKRDIDVDQQLEQLRERSLAQIAEDDVDTRDELDAALDQLSGRARATGSVHRALLGVGTAKEHLISCPGLHLLNAHVGKGQQFDWVAVVGMEDGHVPDFRDQSTAATREEMRVLLVMLSRASYGLLVTACRRVSNRNGQPRDKSPSRWWSTLRDACTGSLDQAGAAGY